MKTLTYEQARSQISDGDLISVFKAHSLFGFATQFFTGQYTHVGIAFWLTDRLWLSETNGGGNHIVPISQLTELGFDVSSPPDGVDTNLIYENIMSNMSVRQPYGFFTTIATGFIEFFKIKLVINWRKGLHCSGITIKSYDECGWAKHDGFTHTRVMSPTKLTKLLKFKFRVTS